MDTATEINLMGLIQNRSALFAAVDKDVEKGFKKFAGLIDKVTNAVHFSLLEKTPVHSGETVRNYIWTQDNPFNGPSVTKYLSMASITSLTSL